jgi:hypothetical protein
VSSRHLGRDLEEDLSIMPSGAKDWGVRDMGEPNDGKRTAISLVLEHGSVSTAAEAAHWLCDRIGVRPEDLGWRGSRREDAPNFAGTGPDDGLAMITAPLRVAQQSCRRPSRLAPSSGLILPPSRDANGCWSAKPIARALKLDAGDRTHREKIKRLLKVWIEDGMFVVVSGTNEKGRPNPRLWRWANARPIEPPDLARCGVHRWGRCDPRTTHTTPPF